MQRNYNVDSKEGIRLMFNEDIEFAEYVSRFAASQNITVDEALEMAIVKVRAIDLISRY